MSRQLQVASAPLQHYRSPGGRPRAATHHSFWRRQALPDAQLLAAQGASLQLEPLGQELMPPHWCQIATDLPAVQSARAPQGWILLQHAWRCACTRRSMQLRLAILLGRSLAGRSLASIYLQQGRAPAQVAAMVPAKADGRQARTANKIHADVCRCCRPSRPPRHCRRMGCLAGSCSCRRTAARRCGLHDASTAQEMLIAAAGSPAVPGRMA
jgi:hypothetical protein